MKTYKIAIVLVLLVQVLIGVLYYKRNSVISGIIEIDVEDLIKKSVFEATEKTVLSENSLFFVETKAGKYILSPKESCAVESAAITHPNSSVTVYNTHGHFDMSDTYSKLLSTLPNVHFKYISLDEIFSHTQLESWHRNNVIQSSQFQTEHQSDGIRLALLYKFGGIYLDTDVIVIQPLEQMKNTIGDSGLNCIVNHVLIFDKNSPFISECMTEFTKHFNGHSYNHQGPFMIDHLIKKWCKIKTLKRIYNQPLRCNGITVKPRETFQPVYFIFNRLIFQRDMQVNLSNSYAYHLNAKGTRNYRAKINQGTFVERLFKKYCPLTYKNILKDGYI
ncbi:hypothetical protein CHUAL_005220 [Chamberlinius hualienensis]